MTFRQYLLVMSLASLVAWTGWILVVLLVDPLSTGLVGLLLFYVSLSSALLGTLALTGLLIRMAVFRRQAVLSKEVSGAFRQSLMISILLIVSLLLQRHRLLTWWNSVLLVVVFGLIELFIFTLRPVRRTLPDKGGL